MTNINQTDQAKQQLQPYEQPPPLPPYSQTISTEIDSRILDTFKATKPWVRFIAVLGFISIGLMVCGALIIIGLSIMASGIGEMNFIQGVAIGCVYLFIAALYALPSVALWKYGSAIKNLINKGNLESLLRTIDSQRSFWKIVGIIIMVWLVLSVISVGFLLVLGVFAAAMGS